MKITNALVSVIVPVYNVEQYLEQCVRSIMAQTYRNIEIILVDDGSPDKCGAMCDGYAKEDSRIRVIHKENGGVSDTRNKGVKSAKGQFIVFVDSDDVVAREYVEKLMVLMDDKTDMTICDSLLFEKDEEIIGAPVSRGKTRALASEAAMREFLRQQGPLLNPAPWGKLYRASLFLNIRYPYGKNYEDMATFYRFIHESRRIKVTTSRLYYYRQRPSSAMARNYNIHDVLEIADEMYAFVAFNYPALRIYAASRVISAYSYLLTRLGVRNCDRPLQHRVYARIVSLREGVLLKRGIRLKNKVATLFSYFGERGFLFLMTLFGRLN